MRPSAVRAAIVQAVLSAPTRGDKRTSRDTWAHLPRRPDDAAPGKVHDRSFAVVLSSQPAPIAIYGPEDLRSVEYLVHVYYNDTPTVEDRIADDAGELATVFDGMFRTQPDVQVVDVTPQGASDTLPGFITVNWSVGVTYRHTLE